MDWGEVPVAFQDLTVQDQKYCLVLHRCLVDLLSARLESMTLWVVNLTREWNQPKLRRQMSRWWPEADRDHLVLVRADVN